MFKEEYKKLLIEVAREAIFEELSTIDARRATMSGQTRKNFRKAAEVSFFQEEQGVFVTLKTIDSTGDSHLRGCIGSIVGREPIYKGVRHYAKEAAFHDPRFYPLQADEFNEVEIEVSVLTPLKPVNSYHDIMIGQDGILLKNGYRSAVFLPQVAVEQNWSLEETLNHLSMKAGLPISAWSDEETVFQVFQAEVFGESTHENTM
ncbi:MAG: AmmeMemoRadiSam system protein A [Spirochaetales bacterium]|nr:AmmeMemoRadiSam system protein A [Spirochaetales bacterium]